MAHKILQHKPSVDNIEQTQPVEGTQQLVGPDEGVAALRFDSLAIEKQERRGAVSSQKSDSPMDQDSQSFPRDEVDTQALKNIVVQAMAAISETQDTDMLGKAVWYGLHSLCNSVDSATRLQI